MTTDRLRTFPFGEPLRRVEQTDRSPKRVFVLGVYSSAVHARWVGPDGKLLVTALAVASEPYIFWRGDGVEEILARIRVPAGAGHLEPAARQLNGPSGVTLDEEILVPLGLTRADAWLCDLVPHTCLNPGQNKALDRAYRPRAAKLGLPPVNLPGVPEQFAEDPRRQQVLDELIESGAETVILLGDQPIRHWLCHFDERWQRLSDFGEYGQLHPVELGGKPRRVLPLAHPRQIGGLGTHSKEWREAHAGWKAGAERLLGR